MPRIAGVSLVGVLLAGIAIWMIGFVFYGLLFSGPWMEGTGLYWADAEKTVVNYLTADGVRPMDAPSPIWMAGGFVLSVIIAFGLGWHMKQKSISTLPTAVLFGLWLSLLIGVPLMAYDFIYTPWHSLSGFLVDGAHTVLSFVVACAILSFFD